MGWGGRIILGLIILGMHRNSGHRHLGATSEVETASSNAPREACDSRDAYFRAERLAELLDLRPWCSPGVVGLMIIKGEQGRSCLPTGPADLMAMGGRQNTHRSSGFNQQIGCLLSERDSSIPV